MADEHFTLVHENFARAVVRLAKQDGVASGMLAFQLEPNGPQMHLTWGAYGGGDDTFKLETRVSQAFRIDP